MKSDCLLTSYRNIIIEGQNTVVIEVRWSLLAGIILSTGLNVEI